MTLADAFGILERNGFSPDKLQSYDSPDRLYAASRETIINRGCSVGTPRAEVMFSKNTGIVARAGNLPKE